MPEETRTTEYLFQFTTAGDEAAAQKFEAMIAKLGAYERQLADKMANIDSILSRGGVPQAPQTIALTPTIDLQALQQAQQAIERAQATVAQFVATSTSAPAATAGGEKLLYEAQTFRDGSLAMTEYRKQLDDVVGTIERSRVTMNAHGREIERLTERTWKSADGVAHLRRELETDITPGIPKEISRFEEWRDGKLRIEEVTRALNDNEQTLIKTKTAWDATGKEMGKLITTTRTLADGTKSTKVEIEGMTQAVRHSTSYLEQMSRHLRWISQGIILWAGINTVSNAIRDWLSVQKDLNWSLAEFEMRTGASPAQLEKLRQEILDVSRATATMPAEIARIAPIAPDEATLRYAAELQRVAGGDMQNQMQWLIAQQRQFGHEGQDTVKILNAMASGWRQTTLPMSQFVTMLRDAAPLSQEFNLSMEEMYAMFGALQAVTGAEGRELDYLVRNLSRLYEPDVQQKLGIQTTQILPTGEVERRNIIAILDEVNQKIKEGEITVQDFASLFGATGRGQRQQIQRVMMAWDSFMQAMTRSMDTPTEWATIFGQAMDTTTAKIDSVKSSWQGLLAAINIPEMYQSFLSGLAFDLDYLALLIRGGEQAKAERREMRFEQYMKTGPYRSVSPEESLEKPSWIFWMTDEEWQRALRPKWMTDEMWQRFTETYKPSGILPSYQQRAVTGDWPEYARSEYVPPAPPAPPEPAQPSYKPETQPFVYPPPLASWPAQIAIPEGVDFSGVIKSMNDWVRAFSALGPQFANWINSNMEMVIIYDENTHHLQLMNVFLPALQRAIAENTQVQKTMKDLQPGLRTVDLDLSSQGGLLQQWVSYYTEFLNRMNFPQTPQPQLVLGINDTFLRLWASNEALMLAIRALTEATEDQTDILSGMWNVPEGATIWVPIQSLFYSRQREQGGPGIVGPPPTILPPQQPEWMKLPGAVDSMSVSNMRVANLEGLTIPEVAEGPPDSLIAAWRMLQSKLESLTLPEFPWLAPVQDALPQLVEALLRFESMTQPQQEMGVFAQLADFLSRFDTKLQELLLKEPPAMGVLTELDKKLAGLVSSLAIPTAETPSWIGQLDATLTDWQRSMAGEQPQGLQAAPTEPTIASVNLGAIQVENITIPTAEIQTPQANIMTPMTRQTSATTDIMTPTTSMIVGTASILAGSLTGLPTFDTSTMESILQVIASTLVMILSSIQNLKPMTYTPPYPVPRGMTIAAAPTPDDIRRFTQESQWWNFTNYSRMRSAF